MKRGFKARMRSLVRTCLKKKSQKRAVAITQWWIEALGFMSSIVINNQIPWSLEKMFQVCLYGLSQ